MTARPGPFIEKPRYCGPHCPYLFRQLVVFSLLYLLPPPVTVSNLFLPLLPSPSPPPPSTSEAPVHRGVDVLTTRNNCKYLQ